MQGIQLKQQPPIAMATSIEENKVENSHEVLSTVYKNRSVVKMLHDVTDLDQNCEHVPSSDFERFDREIDELKYSGSVKAASTSLLLPNVASNVYRDIGILIDSCKSSVRGIYKKDVGSIRRDKEGDVIIWNTLMRCHCKYNDKTRDYDLPTVFSGRFTVTTTEALKEIPELERQLISEFKQQKEELSHNEIVIDYTAESILGVLGTQNRNFWIYRGSHNERVKSVSLEVKDMIKSKLGLDLPVLVFDCTTGVLTDIDDT